MVYISPEGRPTLHSYHQCHSEWSCSLQVPYSSMRCHPQRCLKVKVPQPCPILCDPMDCTVYGILQARILEWVAFPFSRGSSQPRNQTQVSHIADRFFYQLSHKGSSGILEGASLSLLQWIFQPRNRTGISCIAGGFFTH